MKSIYDVLKNVWIFLMLAAGSFWDIRDKSISVRFLLIFASGCILLSLPVFNPSDFLMGLLPGLFLLLFSGLSSGAIGEGDAYALCFIGMSLGLYVSVCVLLIALLVMSIYAQILIIRKRAGIKSRIPMYPYLCLAFILRLIILKGGN